MNTDFNRNSMILHWGDRERFLYACRKGKIPAIKEIRQISGVGLREAKDTVERFGAEHREQVSWIPDEIHKVSPGFQLVFSGVLVEPGQKDEFHDIPSSETILLTNASVMCYDVLLRQAWVTGPVTGADLRALGIQLHNACNEYGIQLEEVIVQIS